MDLIFKDEDTRYQSKIQMGALDNSQIVRTIEYSEVEHQLQPKSTITPL